MATEFKHLKFGLVPSSFDTATLENSETIIKAFLAQFAGYKLMDDASAHAEIFITTRRYIGADFRNWLIVNFRNGGGARKELCRKIVGWIDGRLSERTVLNQLGIDINSLKGVSLRNEPIKTSVIYNEYDSARDQFKVENVDFSIIEDRHFYDFMALIGPELAAKFCLSMDGIYYDR